MRIIRSYVDSVTNELRHSDWKEDMSNKSPSVSIRKLNINETTYERNFITPARAATEFLLKPSHLEKLPKTFRRSPYEEEAPLLMYHRKDVERKAIEVWGSLADLKLALERNAELRKEYEQYNWETKRSLRDARRTEHLKSRISQKREIYQGIVVGVAITVDLLNFGFKLVVWLYTHSDSMLAECIHSAADTFNQTILAVGLLQTQQRANPRHPYGYFNMMYVASLISGVGIFCLGAGVTAYRGVMALIHPENSLVFADLQWAMGAMGFSLFTESITFVTAIYATVKGARKKGMRVWDYVMRSQDPGINVVLLEDMVAVLGVITAATMLTCSYETQSYVPDALGSIIIGGLLACVALFLIVTNSKALVGRSIPKDRLNLINKSLESDVMIRAIYDVKGIDMGSDLVRYKAEIDFDGAQLTRLYLEKGDLNTLLKDMKKVASIDELEAFMVRHGEAIVDLMGSEIDRIEMKLRKNFPEIRHMDLEIL